LRRFVFSSKPANHSCEADFTIRARFVFSRRKIRFNFLYGSFFFAILRALFAKANAQFYG